MKKSAVRLISVFKGIIVVGYHQLRTVEFMMVLRYCTGYGNGNGKQYDVTAVCFIFIPQLREDVIAYGHEGNGYKENADGVLVNEFLQRDLRKHYLADQGQYYKQYDARNQKPDKVGFQVDAAADGYDDPANEPQWQADSNSNPFWK